MPVATVALGRTSPRTGHGYAFEPRDQPRGRQSKDRGRRGACPDSRHRTAALIAALEIGNEPERYAARWYQARGGQVMPGRPAGYDFQAFSSEFSRFRRLLPAIPLAGPATGELSWLRRLSPFLTAVPTLDQVTCTGIR